MCHHKIEERLTNYDTFNFSEKALILLTQSESLVELQQHSLLTHKKDFHKLNN